VTLALRILAVPVTAVIVVVGLWLAGGVITNDFTLAMRLSIGWFALAGLAALAIARWSRTFRWPVLGTFVVTAALVSGYLGLSTLRDRVVHEQVAVAAGRNVLLRSGSFEGVRHGGSGTARVIRLGRGGRVLTLTDFDVARGPDLRVRLAAGPARTEDDVGDVVDLGGLKGNVGEQQYEVPSRADLDRYSTVIIWCRAFSVLFARAPLTA
jgi:hypothetical protein